MNIIALKNAAFQNISSPMSYVNTKNMTSTSGPMTVTVRSKTARVYNGDIEWRTQTPVVRVMDSNVNDFNTGEHTLRVDCPKDWTVTQLDKLQKIARMVYDQRLMPDSCDAVDNFDAFWSLCRKPHMFTLHMPSHSKRGRHRLYVNMYHRGTEKTGTVALTRGSLVKIAVQWTLHETVLDDHVQLGWRPHLAGGIDIVQLPGPPPIVRRPWSWLDVDFERLTRGMFQTMWVKAPTMTIERLVPGGFQVATCAAFDAAIRDFHAVAGATPWTGTVMNATKTRPVVGTRAMLTLTPTRDNNTICWSAVKMRSLPPAPPVPQPMTSPTSMSPKTKTTSDLVAKAEAETHPAEKKRYRDNKDTSSDAKTKRQCTFHGIDDHNPKTQTWTCVEDK